ncbi:MAG: metal ABC transporter substrate-binding protein [Acholeplasmataceae bacterium]|nr:metal ABC transporter substrate-binding protein [Acholeplasmataceae bacterium]
MKKLLFVLLMLPSLVMLASCKDEKTADIVTTMYPQYDFARQIVGDKMSVSLLIPPGAEIHDYDVTSKDLIAIENSKLFIFTSVELNTWVDPLTIGGDDTIVLDLSTSFTLVEHEHAEDDHDDEHLDEEDHDDEHDHDHADDVHFWTDPTTVLQLIDAILEQIIIIDPANSDFYTTNATNYKAVIEDIHHEIDELFQILENQEKPIYFAGHNAMGAFAKRYHINIISLFEAFKPDADLTSAELISFVDEVRNTQTNYIFTEELVNPKTAEKIINELSKYNISMLELHGYHNVTKEDFNAHVSYADLMLRNYQNLVLALGDE